MDEGWIITTAITLGIGVISYFLKKNHEPVGLHSPAASKNRTGFCNKSRSEGNYRRIKKKTSIRSVRIIHPRRLTVRILMGARRRLRRSGRIT